MNYYHCRTISLFNIYVEFQFDEYVQKSQTVLTDSNNKWLNSPPEDSVYSKIKCYMCEDVCGEYNCVHGCKCVNQMFLFSNWLQLSELVWHFM